MKENKLIAEFMGMNYGDPNDNSVMIQMTPQGNEVVPINSMEYHSSWDWLMPVVEKIYQLGLDNESALLVRDAVAEANLDSTYKAVVEFINQ
tara:strand:+ start:3404 stop:3679 length:276 start_codon:yes stop_codon:yes gene_type:complete